LRNHRQPCGFQGHTICGQLRGFQGQLYDSRSTK